MLCRLLALVNIIRRNTEVNGTCSIHILLGLSVKIIRLSYRVL